MKSIGFIGMGNMGSAMLKGMLQVFEAKELVFSRKNKEKAQKFSEETQVD